MSIRPGAVRLTCRGIGKQSIRGNGSVLWSDGLERKQAISFNGYGGKTMHPVVHFEMPYDDRQRMAQFYEAAFGWQTQLLGEDMGHYVLATTTETDEKGPKKPGAINGGFFPKKPDWPAQHPSIVIAGEDIK